MRSTGVGGKKVGNVVTNATRLSRPVRTFSSFRLSNSLGLLRQALPDCLHPPMPSWSPIAYRPRNPEESLLYQVVAGELETFLASHQAQDRTIPKFVEDEFRSFLECGILAQGFVRVRCESCGHSPLSSLSPAAAAERSASPIASRRYFISGLTARVKNPQRMLGCWTGPIGLEHMKSCSAAGRNIRSSPSRAGETPCG